MHSTYAKFLENAGIGFLKSGHNCLLSCPWHEENNPSLSIHSDTGQFICFSCARKGGFLHVYTALTGMDLKEAEAFLFDSKKMTEMTQYAEEVDRMFANEKESTEVFIQQNAFDMKFPHFMHPQYFKYIRGRGIEKYMIDDFHMREGRDNNSDRIILPIRDENGYIVSYSARDVTGNQLPKLRRPHDLKVNGVLYGLYELYNTIWEELPWESIGSRPLILVEGEFDAIYLQQFYLPAVSILGSYLHDDQKKIIIRECNEVYLSMDGDSAGRKAANRIKHELSYELPVFDLRLPEGKDPNQLIPEEIKKIYPSEVYVNV